MMHMASEIIVEKPCPYCGHARALKERHFPDGMVYLTLDCRACENVPIIESSDWVWMPKAEVERLREIEWKYNDLG